MFFLNIIFMLINYTNLQMLTYISSLSYFYDRQFMAFAYFALYFIISYIHLRLKIYIYQTHKNID